MKAVAASYDLLAADARKRDAPKFSRPEEP